MKLVATVLSLALAGIARGERYDQIHFGIHPESSMLAITVVAEGGKKLWRLWPEEVKIEHLAGRMDYTFSYSSSSAITTLLNEATREKKISEPCKAEAKRLTEEPKEMVAEASLTTTIYVPIETPHQDRLTVNAGEGLKILGVRTLQPNGLGASLDKWTQAVSVELEYSAGYSVSFGPSDILVQPLTEKGKYQVVPQKEGLAALKYFSQAKLLSESCTQELNKEYWGPPKDTSDPKYRHTKKISAVLPIHAEGNQDISVDAQLGFTIKSVSVLE